jgi:hypothetical protein
VKARGIRGASPPKAESGVTWSPPAAVSPLRLRSDLQVLLKPREVAVAVVVAERKVVGHVSRVEHAILKHKRLFLHYCEGLLYG